MDKNAIKKFAVWARRELIARVSQRAALYDITDKGYGDASADSVLGRVLSTEEKKQRQALIGKIRDKGYEQVMEEIAYTWFNRFIALRFMEVNGYLPSHVRVFTDDDSNFKPQILTEAIHLELDGLDMEKVYALKNANDDEALFKYLLIVQCNALSGILPGMFQRISDYTELLFPDNLLREGSVIEQMVAMIPGEDWTDQVQIIGWLYQYYNTEPKDKVFADLKDNIKISKENIPAATQLFTPDWIVRYMVENSLGRLWVEGHPSAKEKFLPAHNEDGSVRKEEGRWNHYLEEAKQDLEVEAQLAEIRSEHASLTPEKIRVIDPCCGSGHILCYLFDVLVQIYEDFGYTTREAAQKIVQHNLHGLDIDPRAVQLSYFAVMMKARQYDRRFFSRNIQPMVYSPEGYPEGMEYGSLITVDELEPAPNFDNWTLHDGNYLSALNRWSFRYVLHQKYHVVVTNPPYMGGRNMNSRLLDKIVSEYPEGKADLFSAFILRTVDMTERYGFQAMITMHSWMFLSSFEQLRGRILNNSFIVLNHLGARAFEEISGEVVQTATWVLRRTLSAANNIAKFVRLLDYGSQNEKEKAFVDNNAPVYCVRQRQLEDIPGCAFGYWLDNPSVFSEGTLLEEVANPRQGLKTLNNDYFIRFWHEIDRERLEISAESEEEAVKSGKKWFPLNHGGEYRKYYGNNYTVVNWENNGEEMKANAIRKYNCITRTITNIAYYFKEGITWSVLCSEPSFRWYGKGFIFSNGGQCIVPEKTVDLYYLTGLLNSKISGYLLNMLSPTMGFESGYLKRLPIIVSTEIASKVSEITRENILMAKQDWDSFEISWDFSVHPLVLGIGSLAKRYLEWEANCRERFEAIRSNEESINSYFIKLYNFEKSLTPEVTDSCITLRLADKKRDIKSLISYAVGCMFGRYSIYKEGLIYAGGEWDYNQYENYAWTAEGKPDALQFHSGTHFFPDQDNIIPITDDEYFHDDIANRFMEFVSVVYGSETLEENLRFIADALGGKGSPRDVIRNYFLNDFYADHLRVYQKRPIYWLFDSGKKNGFKCLIYMHRYQPDTIARIRTDYVHEQQSRYRTAIADLENRIAAASTAERVRLSKQLAKLQDQAEELRVYEEKIHHLADQMISIDLDDGVKVNYAKFQDVLAKIK